MAEENVIDIENIKKIFGVVENIKITEPQKCLLNSISDVYYRENFHSDILAYYLSYDSVKEKFIDWINRDFEKAQVNLVDYSIYNGGPAPEREEGRRDITIKSRDETHAIIIENKSNGAEDEELQIPRYYLNLMSDGLSVDAIVYLNKQISFNPLMSDWTEQNIQSKSNCNEKEAEQILKDIKTKLVIATLAGDNGFSQNVIDYVLKDCKSVRECGLSLEIKDLFENIINGEYGMADKDFSDLQKFLSKKANMDAFINLQKVIPFLSGNLRKVYSESIKKIFPGIQKYSGKLYVDFEDEYYMEILFDKVLENIITITFALRDKAGIFTTNPDEYKSKLLGIYDDAMKSILGEGSYTETGFIEFIYNPESVFDCKSFFEMMEKLQMNLKYKGLIE